MQLLLRWSKILLVLNSALFMALVAFGNLSDYGSNYEFVKHVLSMDDIFKNSNLMWRAITHPIVHHAAYALIILWETLTASALVFGAWKCLAALRSTPAEFHESKRFAVVGLVMGLLLWYGAFISVGGEWFAMWQSQTWNGQNAAFRMFAIMGLSLIFLVSKED